MSDIVKNLFITFSIKEIFYRYSVIHAYAFTCSKWSFCDDDYINDFIWNIFLLKSFYIPISNSFLHPWERSTSRLGESSNNDDINTLNKESQSIIEHMYKYWTQINEPSKCWKGYKNLRRCTKHDYIHEVRRNDGEKVSRWYLSFNFGRDSE